MPFWGHFDVQHNISQTLTISGSGLIFSESFKEILFSLRWRSGHICSHFFQTKTYSAVRKRTLGNQPLTSLCTGLDYTGFSEQSPRPVGTSTACPAQAERWAYH